MPKHLPSNTSTFRDIIQYDFLYIDKTEDIYHLLERKKGAYFLTRPRRFGKSLLISTLDELFQGNRALFKGLWIDSSDYVWEVYPVIRIDFSRHPIRNLVDLEESIQAHLQRVAVRYNLELPVKSVALMFETLIFALSKKFDGQQVIILIDEYDTPIIDHIDDVKTAVEIRDGLKGFYSVMKSMEAHIRFIFITGISKFSKVSIFSELNNLTDLTLSTHFATTLGITQDELQHYFSDRLSAFAEKEELTVDDLLEQIRFWYNGFRFSQEPAYVYNPYSTMQLFEHQSFHNFWFESGTPSFLIKLIRQMNYDILELDDIELGELAFSTYDVEALAIVPVLYQTGYLTIRGYDPETRQYKLYFPNYEVENAFLVYILDAFSNLQQGFSESHLWRLIRALRQNDLDTFFEVLSVFFAHIDYDLQVPNEKYYQTIFHVLFTLMGLKIKAEEKTNRGRIDAVVEVENAIYIFEFKLNGSAKEALTQIKTKEYFQKYWLQGKPITLVGANFNSTEREVDEWVQEGIA